DLDGDQRREHVALDVGGGGRALVVVVGRCPLARHLRLDDPLEQVTADVAAVDGGGPVTEGAGGVATGGEDDGGEADRQGAEEGAHGRAPRWTRRGGPPRERPGASPAERGV